MSRDLRTWLDEVKEQFPEELLTTAEQVNPGNYEASALLECFERQLRYPAVLFENVCDLTGAATPFRLLMNVFATTPKIGISLGAKRPVRREIMDEYMERQASTRDVAAISRADAPAKEVVWTGDTLDLRKLPIPRINEMDGGPYLTPIIVARHPQTGRYNVSWNRCMLIDRNHLGIWMSPRHLWSQFMLGEEMERSMPIAIVLGHHPAFFLVGAGLTKMDQDEYRVAGGVMGEPVRVTGSEMWGGELLVPADSEIILEGEIVADRRSIEGPFGEFTGYTGPQRLSWLVEVKALTARKDGIILNTFGGHRDNLCAHYPIQADIFTNLRTTLPNVVDMSWVDADAGCLNMVISMQKKTEGEPMRAAMMAFAQSNFIKHVIVVDEDIDPGNMKQVMWAVATRVQAERDVNVLKGMQGQVLDPSLEHEIRGSGMVIDATKPSGQTYQVRAQPPENVVAAMDLKKYFKE
jgi:2,5-furandicarboxylate decarboxylase 1